MAAQLVSEAIPHFAKPWQLMASVCLTRMNKVTRELSDIENRYARMQEEVELEESVYNNYEYGKLQLQTISADVSAERESEVLQVSQQLREMEHTEGEWRNELKNFTVGARKTKHDENYSVINRKLDDILHCVVKDEKLLLENHTLYPYTCLQPEESLRSAAERILGSYKLTDNAVFFSNAPIGVLRLNFNEKEERGALYRGAKLFFLKAHLHQPVEEAVDGVEWVTLEEFGERADEGYFKKIRTLVC